MAAAGIAAAEAFGLEAFAGRMAALGPFEHHPFLAVAVSGGADSLALTLLADRWARARGGRIVALTVDHGLRPESGAEARQVGAWLAARGIAHEILAWRPPPALSGNRQAAAREARYGLLTEWCRAAGCLHLLTAHHRDDQGETLLLRLARGSGLDGLAGMPAIRELAACRILRPLLDVPRASLATLLEAEAQSWIEDPSNEDRHYARVRLRQAASLLGREGLDNARLAATARRLARSRNALAAMVAPLLARAVTLHPAGFALLAPPALAEAAPEIGLRALASLIATIAGAAYPPRLERLERLHEALCCGLTAARTLGGCRFVPWRGAVLVCREPAAADAVLPLIAGATMRWDGRFDVSLAAGAPGDLTVGALGEESLAGGRPGGADIPGAARKSLPAIRDLVGIVRVPHLQYVRPGTGAMVSGAIALSFNPRRPLTSPGFTVV